VEEEGLPSSSEDDEDHLVQLCLVLSAAFLRCNGVIHRTQKVIQVYDNGHVGRPCEVSLAPPFPELL
jgi:hypothetical protein